MLCNLSMTCDSYCELFGSYRWLPIQLSSAIISCLKICINLQRLRAWQKARNTFAFMLSNLHSCANQKHGKTPLAQSRTMALKLCQHTLPSLPSLPVSKLTTRWSIEAMEAATLANGPVSSVDSGESMFGIQVVDDGATKQVHGLHSKIINCRFRGAF